MTEPWDSARSKLIVSIDVGTTRAVAAFVYLELGKQRLPHDSLFFGEKPALAP